MTVPPEHRFVSYGDGERQVVVEVRKRGVGAELPFAIECAGGRVELTQRQFEFVCAVAPRAQQLVRAAGRARRRAA